MRPRTTGLCWSHTLIVLVLGFGASHAEAQRVSVKPDAFTQAEKAAFVKAHNDARKAVGVNPVEWSDELANYAQQWLNNQQQTLIDAAMKDQPALPEHRPHTGEWAQKYGENVAAWWGGRISVAPQQAVAMWLEEKADFEKKTPDAIVGHYTQIIWKHTRRIGAGRMILEVRDARGRSTQYVAIVCNYDPPGNALGEQPF